MGLLKRSITKKKKAKPKAKMPSSQTILDRLYHLVQVTGKISSEKVPKILGINEEETERLAGILEKEGLIRMHYPAVGGPELMQKGFKETKETKPPIKIKKKSLLLVGALVLMLIIANVLWFIIRR